MIARQQYWTSVSKGFCRKLQTLLTDAACAGIWPNPRTTSLRRLADYRAGQDHFAAGRLLAQNTAYDEAVTEFKAELALHPDNHLALAQLSQVYVQLGKLDLAEPILDQLLALYPGDRLRVAR